MDFNGTHAVKGVVNSVGLLGFVLDNDTFVFNYILSGSIYRLTQQLDQVYSDNVTQLGTVGEEYYLVLSNGSMFKLAKGVQTIENVIIPQINNWDI